MSISADGSVNGKKKVETARSGRRFQKSFQKIRIHPFQISERDVFRDPQALDLMEHGGMRCVAVHAISTAGCNHFDWRLVHAGVTHLHGTGVGAQQKRQAPGVVHIHVEGILHGARRMILGIIQGGKVGPIVLDFGAVSHIETDAMENFFDTLP